MNQRSLVLIAAVMVGGLAVYFAASGRLAVPARKKTPGAAPSQAAGSAAEIAATEVAKLKQSEAGDESAPWGRNPFLTEAEIAKLLSSGRDGLRVKAIIIGPPQPVATIDGQAVAVGEKVGDETVVEINADSVVLEKDGTKRVLKIGAPSITITATEGKRR